MKMNPDVPEANDSSEGSVAHAKAVFRTDGQRMMSKEFDAMALS